MTEPLTRGVHHVGLTVPDLDLARGFFCEALGFRLVGEDPTYPAAFVTDGVTMLTLWRAADPATATPFDRRANIGLHHLALAVSDLQTAYDRVRRHPGVTVETEPGPVRPGSPAHHVLFTIPGGIRLELFAAQA